MSTTLPTPIAAYLEAKKDYDTDALLATLSDDAVITDEGTEYRGEAAIRAWNDRASKAVKATYDVADAATVAGRTIVAVRVAGEFPGSPVTLFFHIVLQEDRSAALTVVA